LAISSARPDDLASYTNRTSHARGAVEGGIRGVEDAVAWLGSSSDYINIGAIAGLGDELTGMLQPVRDLDESVTRIGDAFRRADASPGGTVTMPDRSIEAMLGPTDPLIWLRDFLLGDVATFWTGGQHGFPYGSATAGAIRTFRTVVYMRAASAAAPSIVGGIVAGDKFPVFNTGLVGRGVTRVAEATGNQRFATWMKGPATQTFRRVGIVGGVASTAIGTYDLVQQGNPGDAYQREGAGYVADVASTAFSASTTAFLIAPNPVTGAIAVGSGVVWLGAEVWDEWGEDISGFVDEKWDAGWERVNTVVDAGRIVGDVVVEEAWERSAGAVVKALEGASDAIDGAGDVLDRITPW
jgi:hypothetical protein